MSVRIIYSMQQYVNFFAIWVRYILQFGTTISTQIHPASVGRSVRCDHLHPFMMWSSSSSMYIRCNHYHDDDHRHLCTMPSSSGHVWCDHDDCWVKFVGFLKYLTTAMQCSDTASLSASHGLSARRTKSSRPKGPQTRSRSRGTAGLRLLVCQYYSRTSLLF